MTTELNRVVNNTKVKFINVPIPNEYMGTLSKDTVNKLNEFEKLIASDLAWEKKNITVDFEKPYHAIGYDWIPLEVTCCNCGETFYIESTRDKITDGKEVRICLDCLENEEE